MRIKQDGSNFVIMGCMAPCKGQKNSSAIKNVQLQGMQRVNSS